MASSSSPLPGRTLAIDYGSKRIGFAVSDELGWTGEPLEVWTRRGKPADLDHIHALVVEHEARRVLIGVPNRLDGTVGDAALRALAFAEEVRARVAPVPVITRDEALTTWAAKERMDARGIRPKDHKQWIDAYAALVILEEELAASAPPRPLVRDDDDDDDDDV